MAMDIFKFVLVESGKQTYLDLPNKDPNTMYGIPETNEIYFDGHLLANQNNVIVCNEGLPEAAGEVGKVYLVTNADKKGVYYYDSSISQYVVVADFNTFITATSADTFKNKTINAVENTISNIAVSNMTADAVSTGIAAIETASDSKLTTEKAVRTELDAVAGDIDVLEGKVQALEEGTYDDSAVRGLIQGNTDALTVLNGDEETEGSVANAIAENEIFVTDILTVNSLGGISANADLNGMTTHEILTTLLYPYVAQVVDTPTRTPNSTLLEKGNNQTITAVSVKVTKKSKPITSVALYNGSTLLEEKTDGVANGGTFSFTGLSVSVPSKSVVLTVKVTDASGKVVSKDTAGWTFVYPYYMGSCAEDATIDATLVASLTKKVESKGNKTNAYTCNYERMVFAYPKAHGVLKSILDANGFENLSAFTRSEVSITGLDGTAQAYYVYVNGASTVSAFNMTFKY